MNKSKEENAFSADEAFDEIMNNKRARKANKTEKIVKEP